MSHSEERKNAHDDKSDSPARLGREAKIGAVVILLLIVALGAAIVFRFAGSSGGEPSPSLAQREAVAPKPPATPGEDPLFKGFDPKPEKKRFTTTADEKPAKKPATTVVAAKPAPPKPPAELEGTPSRWKLSSDASESKRIENRYAMPEPPAPRPSHSSRYASLPLDSARSDASGFAEAGAAPSATPPLPPHPARSRYGDDSAAALLPPAAPPPDVVVERNALPRNMTPGDRTMSGAPVSRYADDYRRDSFEPRYDRNELRGRGSPSYAASRRNDGKYEVQPGDSFWTISEKLYGSGAYFNALAEKNRSIVGDEPLKPGQIVQTPSVEELEKAYPDLCPKPERRETIRDRAMTVSTRSSLRGGRTYTVAEGDSLFAIARYELGKASRWVELYELNRDVLGKDINYLTPGMKLRLPDGDRSDDVLTRRPGGEYRR